MQPPTSLSKFLRGRGPYVAVSVGHPAVRNSYGLYLGIDEKKERVLLELLRPVFMMDLPSAPRSSDQLTVQLCTVRQRRSCLR